MRIVGRRTSELVIGFSGAGRTAGQILQLNLDGKVLAATGKPGKGLGEFGEAHHIAVSPRGEIFVADSVNAVLLKFVKK